MERLNSLTSIKWWDLQIKQGKNDYLFGISLWGLIRKGSWYSVKGLSINITLVSVSIWAPHTSQTFSLGHLFGGRWGYLWCANEKLGHRIEKWFSTKVPGHPGVPQDLLKGETRCKEINLEWGDEQRLRPFPACSAQSLCKEAHVIIRWLLFRMGNCPIHKSYGEMPRD